MLRISAPAFAIMRTHAEQIYPNECCGAMLGSLDAHSPLVTLAVPLENAYQGPQADRYEIRPEDLLRIERTAREQSLTVIGIYHSHPDCDAYFSKTDLENACPWYSFVVLSIRNGAYHQAACFRPHPDLTAADPEELVLLPEA